VLVIVLVLKHNSRNFPEVEILLLVSRNIIFRWPKLPCAGCSRILWHWILEQRK